MQTPSHHIASAENVSREGICPSDAASVDRAHCPHLGMLAICAAALCSGCGSHATKPCLSPLECLVADADMILEMKVRQVSSDAFHAVVHHVIKGRPGSEHMTIGVPTSDDARSSLLSTVSCPNQTYIAILARIPRSRGMKRLGGEHYGGPKTVLWIGGRWWVLAAMDESMGYRIAERDFQLFDSWNSTGLSLSRYMRTMTRRKQHDRRKGVGAPRWETPSLLAALEAPVQQIVPFEAARGRVSYILCVGGAAADRVYQWDKDAAAFKERTVTLGVKSTSIFAVVCDIDGDSMEDLVSLQKRQLTVYYRTGNGRFAGEAETLGLPDTPIGVCAVGRRVVVSTSSGPIVVRLEGVSLHWESLALHGSLHSRGSGNVARNEHKREYGACARGDFDGDGFVDLVAPYENGAVFYEGRPEGGFEKGRDAACEPSEPYMVWIVDDEQAGSAMMSATLVRVCMGTPHLFMGRSRWKGTLVCDADRDGRPDIVVVLRGDIVLWRNRGKGRFEGPYPVGVDLAVPMQVCGGVGDLDGDGWADVVVGHTWRPEEVVWVPPSLLLNRDGAGFTRVPWHVNWQERLGSVYGGTEHSAVTVCDANADGKSDVLVGLSDGRVVVIMSQR